jgi:hypothetical protein
MMRLTAQDRWDIADVQAAYCLALDRRDWEALRDVFTADARCDYGSSGSPRGVDAIVDLLRRSLTRFAVTQHVIGTHTVEVGVRGVSASAYLVATHVLGREKFTIAGTYRDTFVPTAQGWRISSRTLDRTWTDGDLTLGRD